MSAYTFLPGDNEAWERAAVAAAKNTWEVVDEAIANARMGTVDPETILGRIVALRDPPGPVSDAEIRAILMGMITGFVPTNTMASGNMLEVLMQRPDYLEQAQKAVRAGDDDLLSRCLFEAMRFMPLNPGPFRVCTEDFVIAGGRRRATKIRKDMRVLISTQSAMFDKRTVQTPGRFKPGRPAHDYMLFGAGLHWCVGALVADAQITQTFKPLLACRKLRRAAGSAGKMSRIAAFPAHLTVEFER